MGLSEYVQKLAGVYAFFMALVGGPIAYQTFEPSEQASGDPRGWHIRTWPSSMRVGRKRLQLLLVASGVLLRCRRTVM